MAYEFFSRGAYVQVKFSGKLTVSDLTAVTDNLDETEATAGFSAHRFVDISEVENVTLSFAAMQNFSAKRRSMTLKNNVRTAIVAKTMVQYGCARMFQMLNQQPQTEVEVFREPDPALKWITKPAKGGDACA